MGNSKSKDLYRTFIDTSNDIIFLKDEKGRYIIVNKHYLEYLGKKEEDVIGKTGFEFRPPDIAEQCDQSDRKTLELNDIVVTEETTNNRTIETRKFPVRLGRNKVGIGCFMRDITEYKQTEEALRQSERRKTILNDIANIFLTIPDEAMYGEVLTVVLRVMRSRYGIFGYIGGNGELVIPSLTRDVWKECNVPDKSIVFPFDTWGESLWGRAIREKKAFYSNEPFRTPEGHVRIDNFLTVPIVFGKETIGLLSVANKEGGYTEEDRNLQEGIAGFISPILNARLQRDIQERRRREAEEALKESEERYRTAIENSNDGVAIMKSTQHLYVNRKFLEIFGYTDPEEIIGKAVSTTVHPDDLNMVSEINRKRQVGEPVPSQYGFKGIKKDGAHVHIEVSAAKTTFLGETVSLVYMRDVTERKHLESQLLQSQKMEAIGTLAGGIAHDFNNILTALIGYGNLLQMKIDKDDPLRVYVDQVLASSEKAANLTQSLLAFSRKQVIELKPNTVNIIIKGIEKLLQRLLPEDIDLKVIPAGTDSTIMADTTQMDQVLINLATNARDAMPRGGTLTIETRVTEINHAFIISHGYGQPGPYVLISVSDTGVGMDKTTMKKIFDPFFTTKEVGKGTGLGLSTVYGIIKQHSGYINVESEPGQGTTFHIYLPVVKAKVKEKEAVSLPKQGGVETILIAEDDPTVRNLIKEILSMWGYTVIEAVDGEDAIRRFMKNKDVIALMILDVVMPKKNGKEAYEEIRKANPDINVIFISGYTGDVVLDKGIHDDTVDFIKKPLLPEELLLKVRAALDKQVL
jgi:PAS domain S-box-containing protein